MHTIPTRVIIIDITVENIGRLMKKFTNIEPRFF